MKFAESSVPDHFAKRAEDLRNASLVSLRTSTTSKGTVMAFDMRVWDLGFGEGPIEATYHVACRITAASKTIQSYPSRMLGAYAKHTGVDGVPNGPRNNTTSSAGIAFSNPCMGSWQPTARVSLHWCDGDWSTHRVRTIRVNNQGLWRYF